MEKYGDISVCQMSVKEIGQLGYLLPPSSFGVERGTNNPSPYKSSCYEMFQRTSEFAGSCEH